MKTFTAGLLLFLLSLPGVLSADPVDKAGLQAVEALGRLNGVALSCRYFDQVKRIKQILIDNLPKRRELGQLFEDTTNASFKEFIGSGAACPSPVAFTEDVGTAREELQKAFAAK